MKVKIFVLGHLTDVVPNLKKEYIDFEICDGCKLKDLVTILGIKNELIHIILLNEQREKDLMRTLKEGDRITFFSPTAGG